MTRIHPRHHALPLTAALALALLALTLPLPGSLSVRVTRAGVQAFDGTPGLELLSDIPLALLAAATVIALVHSWITRPAKRLTTLVTAATVAVAYLASELLKLAIAEPRPCATWALAGACPVDGDWSFPSNHATLAFGAAVVIAVATRSVAATTAAVAAAIVVASARVIDGEHYLHDVAAGAVLGIVTVGATAVGVSRPSRKPTAGAA